MTRFEVKVLEGARKIDPACLVQLAGKFPNLEKWSTEQVGDHETRFVEMEQQVRMGMFNILTT